MTRRLNGELDMPDMQAFLHGEAAKYFENLDYHHIRVEDRVGLR
jgi:hypothetical protein